MDHNSIYISYLTRVTEAVQPSTLSAIMHSVRSGEWKEAVEAVRFAKVTDKQRIKQQRLPAFFPTVRLGEKNVLDEASIPTGIIQFDLDLKDNPLVDLVALRAVLESFPETLYVFTSPSGGLKFGLQTDFHRHEEEHVDSLKSRYKVAYGLALNWVQQRCPSPLSLDPSVGNLKYACYLSDDPSAYLNPDANPLLFDADCHSVAADVVQPVYAPIHNDQVVELLRHIPGDLSYDARLPINIALFTEIGADALSLLESHWTTSNRTKLKKDLQQQYRSVQQGTLSGTLGTLVNAAKQHGWRPISGEKRKSLRPQKTTETLSPLLTPKDAESALKKIVGGSLSMENLASSISLPVPERPRP